MRIPTLWSLASVSHGKDVSEYVPEADPASGSQIA